jgi:hypothetical protein
MMLLQLLQQSTTRETSAWLAMAVLWVLLVAGHAQMQAALCCWVSSCCFYQHWAGDPGTKLANSAKLWAGRLIMQTAQQQPSSNEWAARRTAPTAPTAGNSTHLYCSPAVGDSPAAGVCGAALQRG